MSASFRQVWVLPGVWADAPESEEVWARPRPGLEFFSGRAELFRLHAHRGDPRAWVGLPGGSALAAGPLMVAALGLEPPSRSVHYWLSLMSADESGRLHTPETIRLDPPTRAAIEDAMARLATRRLHPRFGIEADHALVIEQGSLDVGTAEPEKVTGQFWFDHRPEGDDERLLRTLIDDSLNLLDGLEFNRRRADEGLPKLNLLWPWGPGFPPEMPNLALRRGEIAEVHGGEGGRGRLQLKGICYWVGYRFEPGGAWPGGAYPARGSWARFLTQSAPQVVVMPHAAAMTEARRWDVLADFLDDLDRELLQPLASRPADDLPEFTLLFPDDQEGLGLRFGPGWREDRGWEFSPALRGESRLPLRYAHELVHQALAP